MSKVTRIAVGNISFNVNIDGYEAYWNSLAEGKCEKTTFDVIDRNCGPGKLFIDCGGWIGGTTLPAAAKGSRVVVYEPNPVAVLCLRENIALNPSFAERITIREVALNTESGTAKLFNDKPGGYRNTRSTLFVEAGEFITVPSLDVKDAVHNDNWAKASLIKCDIESGEYFILPRICEALGSTRPPALIEFHPTYLLGNSSFSQAIPKFVEAIGSWPRCQRAEDTFIDLEQSHKALTQVLTAAYDDPERGEIINPRLYLTNEIAA
jgi:FkbM family methyltransferase